MWKFCEGGFWRDDKQWESDIACGVVRIGFCVVGVLSPRTEGWAWINKWGGVEYHM